MEHVHSLYYDKYLHVDFDKDIVFLASGKDFFHLTKIYLEYGLGSRRRLRKFAISAQVVQNIFEFKDAASKYITEVADDHVDIRLTMSLVYLVGLERTLHCQVDGPIYIVHDTWDENFASEFIVEGFKKRYDNNVSKFQRLVDLAAQFPSRPLRLDALPELRHITQQDFSSMYESPDAI